MDVISTSLGHPDPDVENETICGNWYSSKMAPERHRFDIELLTGVRHAAFNQNSSVADTQTAMKVPILIVLAGCLAAACALRLRVADADDAEIEPQWQEFKAS